MVSFLPLSNKADRALGEEEAISAACKKFISTLLNEAKTCKAEMC